MNKWNNKFCYQVASCRLFILNQCEVKIQAIEMLSVPRCRLRVADVRGEVNKTVVKYRCQEAGPNLITGGQLRSGNKCSWSITFCELNTILLLSITLLGGGEEICLNQQTNEKVLKSASIRTDGLKYVNCTFKGWLYICTSSVIPYAVKHRLTMGIHSEKCVVRRFHRRANVIECSNSNLDSITYYTPRLYRITYYSWGTLPVAHLIEALRYRP